MANENPDEPVVDPPQATADDMRDPEAGPNTGWVTIGQQATVTLPSGASYALNPGETMQLQAEDADYIINEGYGTKADEPSGE
jgi:hypothetical protein